jgi:hypothetical protein
LSRPGIKQQPCLRYSISEVALYRAESRPGPHWTQRWKTVDVIDIQDWANTRTRTIHITQGLPNASFELKVREFAPLPGDALHKVWKDNGQVRSFQLRPFAIVEMRQAAESRIKYLDQHIGTYVQDTIPEEQGLFRNTYLMAFKHAKDSKVSD